MNIHWKKGVVTAALSLLILAQGAKAHAESNYKVKEADTFWKLSVQFGVSVEQLMQANPGVEASNVYKGMNLVIPSAKKETAVKDSKVAEKSTQVKAASTTKEAVKIPVSSSKVTVRDKTYTYTDVVQVKASAYTSSSSENGSWGAVDYFGNPLKLGTISVDPDVIPMGSKVYITGYNFSGLPTGGMMAVASDQGGGINGNRIDIYVPGSQKFASNFGFQYVKVYILD